MCLGPSEVTFCSGICSSVILAPGRYTFALAFALSVSWPQGGNLLLWHLLERWLCPREVTFCSGICSSGGFCPREVTFWLWHLLQRWLCTRGTPRGPAGPPHNFYRILSTGTMRGVTEHSLPN